MARDGSLTKLNNSLLKVEKDLELKDSQIKNAQKKYEALETKINENKLKNIKEYLENKNAHINSLERRVDEFEKVNKAQKKQHDKKLKELENLFKNKFKKETVVEVFKCSNCEFEAKTKGGLKIYSKTNPRKKQWLRYYMLQLLICSKDKGWTEDPYGKSA